MRSSNEPIDFVILWVDGSDPEWQKERNEYSDAKADLSLKRYRDWDQLRYWFRAVEMYAPWVNKIHFVTWGHLPAWLDTNHPKLHIVNHRDFIPQNDLPLFNSSAIEINIHNIPGLSEQFVYFNDDTFLMARCEPKDFFVKGKPVIKPEFVPVPSNIYDGKIDEYWYYLYNDYSVGTSYLSKKRVLRNIFKYFNLKYGKSAFSNLINLLARNMYSAPPHICAPYLKSAWKKVWADHPEPLSKTSASKFRAYTNNTQMLFRTYHVITGEFHPGNVKRLMAFSRDPYDAAKKIKNTDIKFMCINDCDIPDKKFEEYKKMMNDAFDERFKHKSTFEL